MSIYLLPLPYLEASLYFEYFAPHPWACWLDSCQPFDKRGDFDVMVAFPKITLTTRDRTTTIVDHTTQQQSLSAQNPFSLIKNFISPASRNHSGNTDIPFSGGALGYFAYDLARQLEPLPNLAQNDISLPDMAIGIYDWALVCDHQKKNTYLASQLHWPETQKELEQLAELLQHRAFIIQQTNVNVGEKFQLCSPFQSNLDFVAYQNAFNTIQNHLLEGDCYEINLARRFSAKAQGNVWPLYLQMRMHHPAPFSAFLHFPEAKILSSSPERFLKTRNKKVFTQPIKGTRPRGKTLSEDQALREELKRSEKDQAENLMIVDLLRNDLGKGCETGSVQVTELFGLHSYSHVHHLVSTIEATLQDSQHSIDVLQDCFPGGSITGAPKIRAMEIIESLEPHRRSVYCGAIGYLGFDGNMDTNIAIRTAIYTGSEIHCYGGGAIVADSTAVAEFEESFKKVEALLKIFSGSNDLSSNLSFKPERDIT